MSVIKKQLKAFYRAQGLSGKHLRSALRWDMRTAKANALEFAVENGIELDVSSISNAFDWSESKQGFDYWADRCITIETAKGFRF